MAYQQESTPSKMRFEIPPLFSIEEKVAGNPIFQLLEPGCTEDVTVEIGGDRENSIYIISLANGSRRSILAVLDSKNVPADANEILKVQPLNIVNGTILPLNETKAQWLRHPRLGTATPENANSHERLESVLQSWKRAFTYQQENPEKGVNGLRSPQIGAIHAIHAHWSVSENAATIVMPTGTGKTETMLSVLVTHECQRVLVVVPTDALRTQISEKFMQLGILKKLGVLADSAQYPVVGILRHKPKSVDAVDALFLKCHVIVTTMNVAGQSGRPVQERMAQLCSHLFIDEAHHVPAKTWSSLKEAFSGLRILQFTATPFREDGNSIEGKIIYNYPLKKAQDEGYFRPIKFKSILEYDRNKRDITIAEAAVSQLREDLDKGHILMARVDSIKRAEQVYEIYRRYTEFHPVRIHTGLNQKEREDARRQILSGQSKIVICVDMLGEGFDLPELKIAAFHDIRKSLPVTLQLAGRFTRARPDLGNATFIANIADVDVSEELRKLYIQDPDWNALLPEASQAAIEEEKNLWEFLEGFEKFPNDISLLNLRPAMSTVVYKTRCANWSPERFKEGIKGIEGFGNLYHDINHQRSTLVIVTNKKVPVDWARSDKIYTWEWELYIVFWDKDQKLLFIHSSSNAGYFEGLAKAIGGNDVELVRGATVFRCFSGINRLRMQNVGLLKTLGRLIRFEMRAGSDVEPALTEAERRNTIRSNVFGLGFEGGYKTTMGCSYKGRLWSQQKTNLAKLIEWCSLVGSKLLDEGLDPNEILKGTLVPQEIMERPQVFPISIEWPEIVYLETETAFQIIIGDEYIPIQFVDINLISASKKGELHFEIKSNEIAAEFLFNVYAEGEIGKYSFTQTRGEEMQIEYHSNILKLTDFFLEFPPTIWFADGSSLQGNSYVQLKQQYKPYPAEKILVGNWDGINLRKESQGVTKEADSIQFRVIQELRKQPYAVIFDDDSSGEVADIVAIRIRENDISIELYHCKYSHGDLSGQRIADLYEVCGQAQKSVHWAERPTNLFSHLLRREPRREKGNEYTRFEIGSSEDLLQLQEMSRKMRVNFKIHIVQPGLSKQNVSIEQLELLSVTENYLMETYMIPFGIIANQ